MPDSTFNFAERAAALAQEFHQNWRPTDIVAQKQRDRVEHELRATFDAGWRARIAAEESNIAVFLDVNEGEHDPLNQAAKRCFDAAFRRPSSNAQAVILEELRTAFMAGREVQRKQQAREGEPFVPAEAWDRASFGGHDRPVDMPAPCLRPHALEIPLPEGSTYLPMTTAAQSVLDLAEKIETRAKNDLLVAEKLRGLL